MIIQSNERRLTMPASSRLKRLENDSTNENNHRLNVGRKKTSWINSIVHVISIILIGITGYSMWKEPLFIFKLSDSHIGYEQLKDFKSSLSDISRKTIESLTNLNQLGLDGLASQIQSFTIDSDRLNSIQSSIDQYIIAFNIFFILCIISLVISILTIFYNRIFLKLINILIMIVMLVITVFFNYSIHILAEKLADLLKNPFLKVSPDQLIHEADATHNAIILLACTLVLIFLSLFFRGRRKL